MSADISVSPELQKARITQNAQPYFIQVAVYPDAKKFFPKLYPIGYILKDTDANKNITKYLLGDFATETEAIQVLKEVKGHGYKDAFVVHLGS
jgi:hypothetical protein